MDMPEGFSKRHPTYIDAHGNLDTKKAVEIAKKAGILDENGELTEFYRTSDVYKPRFRVEYIKGLYAKINEINKYTLNEIDVYLNKESLEFTQEELDEWKALGLKTSEIIRDFL